MGTQGVHMKGVLPWLGRSSVVPERAIFVLPWLVIAQVSPIQNIFFSALPINFTSFVPVAQQAG
jgi:hypothetical protein